MGKAIVHLISGEKKDGDILAFNSNLPIFYLQSADAQGRPSNIPVRIDSVRTIHFLKKKGDAASQLRDVKIQESVYAGTVAFRLHVEFKDGSIINGTATRYNPNDRGFFIVPINPADRSERIFINASEVKRVDSTRLLGRILVEQKRITKEQIEEGLRYQEKLRNKPLGTILMDEKMISERQLSDALLRQRRKYRLLGEILLEAGYISEEQLEYALSIQRMNRSKKIGRILVDIHFLTPNDICIALASQFDCKWIDLSEVKIPLQIAAELPIEIERHLEVIPIEIGPPNTLYVATACPQDPGLWGEISRYTDFKVELVVAYEEYIQKAIEEAAGQRGAAVS